MSKDNDGDIDMTDIINSVFKVDYLQQCEGLRS